MTYYGYPNVCADAGKSSNYWYYATQMLVWEGILGYRDVDPDSDTFGELTKGKAFYNYVTFANSTQSTKTIRHYKEILESAQNHYSLPEDSEGTSQLFATTSEAKSTAYQLTYNFSNKRYQCTITIANEYLNSDNSYAYKNLVSDINESSYLTAVADKGSKETTITVYTKAEFSGTITIETKQSVSSVASGLSYRIYARKGETASNGRYYQPVYIGTYAPDAQTAYISFQTPDNLNLKVFKKFTLNGKNVGTDKETIEDYCDDCKFLVKTSINGEANFQSLQGTTP
ncbi:MAG: thioester domain-containing protein [Ruminococcus sp.]|nr:thioester domain-containing protein [Ruminococcus sp.]